ncbi:hypothetical protein CURE108131_23230 [Cupriavidus respiraculi]|uniref:Uncharacterized protein n=1 Tax=Cupriavidus respiraculi TaxID=195930 RepID=A0ABM8WXS3_9BURK|nr:hypothetical protein [Cupriavidus respiraculi]CAG9172365.1 hypothetical protein LMG21510_01950 [Cupriavidus respiraculi]
MRRISTATRVIDKFGAGKDGFTNGDAVSGIPATDLEDVWFDHVQEELANVVEATGGVVNGSSRDQVLQAIQKLVRGAVALPSVRGLLGSNNTATPNSKYDISAQGVVLRAPASGNLASVYSAATLTCDVAVAGPAANGRDQVGVFPPSTWLHLYYIWNGTALATIASTVAPPTGPTLPSGYTHWAYIGALYFNAGSQLVKTRYRGACAHYYVSTGIVSSGSATTETPVSLATSVPPNALTVLVGAGGQMNTNGSGSAQTFLAVRVDSGLDSWTIPISTPLANATGLSGGTWEVPNVGQNLFYLWFSETNSANISLRAASIGVFGYTVPNGGC